MLNLTDLDQLIRYINLLSELNHELERLQDNICVLEEI